MIRSRASRTAMSRIFQAITKHNLIEFSGTLLDPGAKPSESPVSDESPAACYHPTPSLSGDSFRTTRMRISGLAPVFPFQGNNPVASNQYRIIRTRILHNSKKQQFIIVSSPSAGDGKTITAINLAICFAMKEKGRVLLVDGDFQHPRIANILGITGCPGLSPVVAGSADLTSAIVRTEEYPSLHLLCAPNARQDTSELLDSERGRMVVQQLRSRFEYVFVDAPPIGISADYELLELASDAVLVVIRPEHTPRRVCMKSLRAVAKQKLLGVIVNGASDSWLSKLAGYEYCPKTLSGESVDPR